MSILTNQKKKHLLNMFSRLGNQGLIVGNITRLVALDDGTWFGTESGAMFWRKKTQSFSYFAGSRYKNKTRLLHLIFIERYLASTGLIDSTIMAMAADSSKAVFVTKLGLSVLSFKMMTLGDKAGLLEQTMARHLQTSAKSLPNGTYLVGDCSLARFGDPSSFVPISNDNNGLWTSMYLLGQCFRYAQTKNATVKENAWKFFLGLKLLNDVTEIPGLVARSVMWSATDPNSKGSLQWRPASSLPAGFWWKSDTSSDEISGHLAVYGAVHDLLAETEDEKDIAKKLISDMVTYIVQNGFRLIDWTGRPTSWGHWDPQTLNFNFSSWYDIRGLNSLQILSWLRIGYRYGTSEAQELFAEAFLNLTRDHGYDKNMINARITEIDDVDYSGFSFFSPLKFSSVCDFIFRRRALVFELFLLDLGQKFKPDVLSFRRLYSSFFQTCESLPKPVLLVCCGFVRLATCRRQQACFANTKRMANSK